MQHDLDQTVHPASTTRTPVRRLHMNTELSSGGRQFRDEERRGVAVSPVACGACVSAGTTPYHPASCLPSRPPASRSPARMASTKYGGRWSATRGERRAAAAAWHVDGDGAVAPVQRSGWPLRSRYVLTRSCAQGCRWALPGRHKSWGRGYGRGCWAGVVADASKAPRGYTIKRVPESPSELEFFVGQGRAALGLGCAAKSPVHPSGRTYAIRPPPRVQLCEPPSDEY